MKSNNVMGVVFANVHDDLISELTSARSMASVPFGGRYRLIDFSLSNLVNAGITKVGVIPRFNYHSLMDHLGSGKPWDLDRKSGGLSILPPYITPEISVGAGHINSINSIMNYLDRSKEKYVVMCDADVIGNINIEKMLEFHFDRGADITVAYKNGRLPKSHGDIMTFELDGDNRISEIRMPQNSGSECNFSLDVVIIERKLIMDMAKSANEKNLLSLWRDVFMPSLEKYKFFGYEIKEYAIVVDGAESYAKASFDLLNPEIRKDIFNSERPIYTKTRDDFPTKYGLNSCVKNSLIADGCIIEGNVKNCIIFRGVKILEGAKLENCIIMQDTVVGKNADIKYVISDKNATISDGLKMCGAPKQFMIIHKFAEV